MGKTENSQENPIQKIEKVGKQGLIKSKLGKYKNLTKKINNLKKLALLQQKQELLQKIQEQKVEQHINQSQKKTKKPKKSYKQKQQQQQMEIEEEQNQNEKEDNESLDLEEEKNEDKLSKEQKKRLSRKQKQKLKKQELQQKKQKKQEILERSLIKNHIRTDIEFFRLQQIKKLNQQFLDMCKGQKIVPPLLAVERWRWRNKFLENTNQHKDEEDQEQEQENSNKKYNKNKIQIKNLQNKKLQQQQQDQQQQQQNSENTNKKVITKDSFFPITGSHDSELINSLKQLKVPIKKAKQMVYNLAKQSRKIVEQINEKLKSYNKSKVYFRLQNEKDETYQVFYSPDGKSQNQKQICVITKSAYNKLYLMYGQHNKNMNDFQERLFNMLTRYKCLQGPGSQAAIPEKVFEILKKDFEAKFECFASPLNCYFRDNYCSAFNDVDSYFGSKGNFFDYQAEEGSFQANPPFIPEIMTGMQLHMEKLLEKSQKPLSFCLVVPAWENQDFWKKLQESKFQSGMFVINKDQHKYKEGLQHEKQTGLIRKSPHDTGFIFLQNEQGKQKWGFNKSKEIKIREAMNVKI